MDDFHDPVGDEATHGAPRQPIEARPVAGEPSWGFAGPDAVPDAYSAHIGTDVYAGTDSASLFGAPFPSIDQSPAPAAVDLFAVISLLVAFGVYSYSSGLAERIGEWVPSVGALGWVFANGLIAMFCVGVTLALRGQSFRALGLRGAPLRLLVPATLAGAPAAWATGIFCNILFVAFQTLRGVSMEHLFRDRMGFISAISEIDLRWVLPLSIFVGIYEEVFFRGFVMTRLASITRSRVAAVILSSLLFGAVHFTQGPLGVFQTTCLGLVLAGAAVMGRSLWPAIIAHVAIDSLSLGMSVLFRPELMDAMRQLTTTQAGS